MKRIVSILITLLTIGNQLKAQQDAMFTHYMYNTLWLNPAYAGTRDALTVTGIHRSQWVGFDGAPLEQSLTMHTPILNGKMGAGLSVLNDKIGPTKSTLVAIDLSYQLKLNSKSKLGFGLKGLANFYRNNISTLTLDQQNDVAFAQNVNTVLPNVGAGLYYYRERFYMGISTPKLLENKLGDGVTATSKEQRHYFMIIGAVFNLSKDLKLKPTAFVKATEAAPIEGDVTAMFLYKEKFNIGAMYRTGDAVGALVGYNFTEQFYLGYSFDWSMANTTGKYNSGSHEIMLRYDLIYKSKAKIKSPRYF
ncbi:MAG: type IX secretion system membrane protein PorP/SprF [Sphingobacteriaceae bacterium]|nr:type IX secretion system membrane protein PorP/SprF [Sphingobacteriaceae bacterium]